MEKHLESQPQLQSQIQVENDDEAMPSTNSSFSDLKTATKNFSSDEIISKNADESSNIVYKGESESFGSIAVKKLENMADPDQFTEEAQRVGQLRDKREVNPIGCCCDGDERFLDAEFLPNDTLAKRLFEQDNHTMERPSSSPKQCQRPPRKQATLVAGCRRSGPNRKHKTAIQTDEERENQKREEIKKLKIYKVAQKSLNKLEKPKAKKEESPSNPGPSTKPRRNQF